MSASTANSATAAPGALNLDALLRQQQSLRVLIELISGEQALRPLLTQIVRSACELLGAERGTIGLVDEGRSLVRTEAIFNMPPNELGAEMRRGEGLAGRVLDTGAPVVLGRYGDLERPLQADLLEDTVIGMPIFWRDSMIGFFGIGAAPGHRFEPHDVETLAFFARHAAIAIENARRHEAEQQRSARFELIARIGQRIAARLDPVDLFAAIADDLHERLGYDHVSLFLLDPADPTCLVQRARASRWPRQTTGLYRQPIAQGILGAAARQRAPQLVNDVGGDVRFVAVPGAEVLCAELAVPILLGERLLGVLDVAGTSPFNQEDVRALQVVADQLAVALDNAALFGQTQRTLAETRLLYETSQRISQAADVDDVIVAYLEQVAARGHYACTVVLYESDAAGSYVGRVSRGRWTPQEGLVRESERHPYSRDALDAPLDAGQTVLIADVATDPRVSAGLRAMQEAAGRLALAMIPLMTRAQRIGLVVLSADQAHEWSEADLWPYQATAAQLATAIDSRRQNRLLYQRGRQLAVLEERQRLARELHDSVTQLIFSITLIAQSIAPAWRREPGEGERRVARLLELSQAALAEMRALLTELRPAEGALPHEGAPSGFTRVRQEGLVAALRHHAALLTQDSLRVEVDAAGYPSTDTPLPPDHEEALFRIVQEALNNVVKHARAQQVRVALRADRAGTRLTIQDDGVGFEPVGAAAVARARGGGLGLQTMRERAAEIGGTVRLDTTPGRGTTVEVTLPHQSPQAAG